MPRVRHPSRQSLAVAIACLPLACLADFDGFPIATNYSWQSARNIGAISQLVEAVQERCVALSNKGVGPLRIVETWTVQTGYTNAITPWYTNGAYAFDTTNRLPCYTNLVTTNCLGSFVWQDATGTNHTLSVPITQSFVTNFDAKLFEITPFFVDTNRAVASWWDAATITTDYRRIYLDDVDINSDGSPKYRLGYYVVTESEMYGDGEWIFGYPNDLGESPYIDADGIVNVDFNHVSYAHSDWPYLCPAAVMSNAAIGYVRDLQYDAAGLVTNGAAYFTRQPQTAGNWVLWQAVCGVDGWWESRTMASFDRRYYDAEPRPVFKTVFGPDTNPPAMYLDVLLEGTGFVDFNDPDYANEQVVRVVGESITISSSNEPSSVMWFRVENGQVVGNAPTGTTITLMWTNYHSFGAVPYNLQAKDIDERCAYLRQLIWTTSTNMSWTNQSYQAYDNYGIYHTSSGDRSIHDYYRTTVPDDWTNAWWQVTDTYAHPEWRVYYISDFFYDSFWAPNFDKYSPGNQDEWLKAYGLTNSITEHTWYAGDTYGIAPRVGLTWDRILVISEDVKIRGGSEFDIAVSHNNSEWLTSIVPDLINAGSWLTISYQMPNVLYAAPETSWGTIGDPFVIDNEPNYYDILGNVYYNFDSGFSTPDRGTVRVKADLVTRIAATETPRECVSMIYMEAQGVLQNISTKASPIINIINTVLTPNASWCVTNEVLLPFDYIDFLPRHTKKWEYGQNNVPLVDGIPQLAVEHETMVTIIGYTNGLSSAYTTEIVGDRITNTMDVADVITSNDIVRIMYRPGEPWIYVETLTNAPPCVFSGEIWRSSAGWLYGSVTNSTNIFNFTASWGVSNVPAWVLSLPRTSSPPAYIDADHLLQLAEVRTNIIETTIYSTTVTYRAQDTWKVMSNPAQPLTPSIQAWASSTRPDSSPDYAFNDDPPDWLCDTNTDGSPKSLPQWVSKDIGETLPVYDSEGNLIPDVTLPAQCDKFWLKQRADGDPGSRPREVDVQYSTDNSTWTTLDTIECPNDESGSVVIHFTAVMARYWRVRINTVWGTYNAPVAISEAFFYYSHPITFWGGPNEGDYEFNIIYPTQTNILERSVMVTNVEAVIQRWRPPDTNTVRAAHIGSATWESTKVQGRDDMTYSQMDTKQVNVEAKTLGVLEKWGFRRK